MIAPKEQTAFRFDPALITMMKRRAQTLGMDDFEDATQVACALGGSCFIAVSRDRDFAPAPIVVMSPNEFLTAVTATHGTCR